MPLVNGTGNSPSPGRPTPGVVKQDKSSGGCVDTTNTRSTEGQDEQPPKAHNQIPRPCSNPPPPQPSITKQSLVLRWSSA